MVCQCDAMCEVGCTIYVTVGENGLGWNRRLIDLWVIG